MVDPVCVRHRQPRVPPPRALLRAADAAELLDVSRPRMHQLPQTSQSLVGTTPPERPVPWLACWHPRHASRLPSAYATQCPECMGLSRCQLRPRHDPARPRPGAGLRIQVVSHLPTTRLASRVQSSGMKQRWPRRPCPAKPVDDLDYGLYQQQRCQTRPHELADSTRFYIVSCHTTCHGAGIQGTPVNHRRSSGHHWSGGAFAARYQATVLPVTGCGTAWAG